MKRTLVIILMFMLMALISCDSSSSGGDGGSADSALQNLTGTWKGSYRTQGGEYSGAVVMVLEQNGTAVKGSVTVTYTQGTMNGRFTGTVTTTQAPGSFLVSGSFTNGVSATFSGDFTAVAITGTLNDGNAVANFKLAKQ